MAASSTRLGMPSFPNRVDNVSPVGPAPTTTTGTLAGAAADRSHITWQKS